MTLKKEALTGLTSAQVTASRSTHGKNSLEHQSPNRLYLSIIEMFKEPMIILLFVAAAIYFITGKIGDGFFMLGALLLITTISLYQISRSKKAIQELERMIQPKSKVIRNGHLEEIPSEMIVVGDCIQVEEGNGIPADARLILANDLMVNESVLTGESLSVSKDENPSNNTIFQGTTVATGLGIGIVTAIGNQTQLGKIGKSLSSIQEDKTPLQKQMENFVKKISYLGLLIFAIVWGINFYQSRHALDSLLQALTLAMSIIPEEIPVAFTTFMALGSWRLLKMGIIVKDTKTIETLGSATVICTDKTGTITENKMSMIQWYSLSSNTISDAATKRTPEVEELFRLSIWASELIPFDAMEKALHKKFDELHLPKEVLDFKMIQEYPLSGIPPLMTHVIQNNQGEKIIAAKGAPEAIIAQSKLSAIENEQITQALNTMTSKGFRVLGVAKANWEGKEYPKNQEDFVLECKGLIAFYDPPKSNIKSVFETIYNAGIEVKIITGDNAQTTATIAQQVGFKNHEKAIDGEALMALDEESFTTKVMETHLFTRMFPEAKLKIIQTLKANHQIVAMTGDGVNDGPALKSAHIGIAMGQKGTEIAKQAANLILIQDNFASLLDGIAMGRKIYMNLKKAIQYIISIHIAIILIVFIPLALGWKYPSIFSPVHVIFLEIIMGPTCSIIYENEPMEKNLMLLKPRSLTTTFFNWKEILLSGIQGIAITIGLLFMYQYSIYNNFSENHTRTLVFVCMVSANIFLTLSNRSFYYSILTTIQYKNNLVLLIVGVTIFMTSLLLFVPPLSRFFQFESVSFYELFLCIAISSVSVFWIEVYTFFKRRKKLSLI